MRSVLRAVATGVRPAALSAPAAQPFRSVRWCTEPPAVPEAGQNHVDEKTRLKTNDFYVGGGSSVNKLAGASCYALREFESAGMRAIGPRAVNQAVKATAVARNFLAREGKGVLGRVENARVVSYERTTNTMPKLGAHVLLYNNKEVIEVQEREDERIMTVAARTLPRNLAAAIKQSMVANRNVTIRGVGPEAVENMALGVGFARNYCKQDEDCDFDIGFVSEFTSLGENVTGISMMLIKLPPVAKDDAHE